jgi:L-amino acid N-acyltransferase YncA
MDMIHPSALPQMDLNTYQKEAKLKDGTVVVLRLMVAEDKAALYEFFKSVPREETRLLRDDVSSYLLIEKWADKLDYDRTLPILATKNGLIVADATINRRRTGWKWHLGTVRIFVHQDYRNVGLGRLMLDEISEIAAKIGLEKLFAEIPDTSTAAINAFTKSGFYRAAVIPNMAKDQDNMPLDIVVMIKDIKPAFDEFYDFDF